MERKLGPLALLLLALLCESQCEAKIQKRAALAGMCGISFFRFLFLLLVKCQGEAFQSALGFSIILTKGC